MLRKRLVKEGYTLSRENEVADFCNDIISSFEENGIACDVYWNPIGCGEIILFDADSDPVTIGSIFIQHDVNSYSGKGKVVVQNRLDGSTKVVSSFTQGVLDYGDVVFNAFNPSDVEEAIGRRDESRKYRMSRKNSR